jgi:tRNA(fMet)-specific endonuclease VapC
MGKNDIWIAAIALFYDLELWSLDNDFDHLVSFGLKLTKKSV